MQILLTNDDGIHSRFLHAIAGALNEHFDIIVAAPKTEQSWIGRAVSRSRIVSVEPHPELPWKAWTIDGTPTDCVNIALGNLLSNPPAAVVSGINIGYNTTSNLIYSSGTVAGALEGAFWGLPAFAVSQEVPDQHFGLASANHGQLPPHFREVLLANARHAVGLIQRMLCRDEGPGTRDEGPNSDAIVHNLNYPADPLQPYETVLTVPAPLQEMPFFEQQEEGLFRFRFRHGQVLPCGRKTDREAIAAGEVSHSILNFSAIGRDLNH
ncbi:MAG: 5'/3'-nucleotidase SurE [Oceanipulchritudo sp.]